MAIKVGDRLPDGKLMESTEFDSGTQCAMPPKEVNVADAAGVVERHAAAGARADAFRYCRARGQKNSISFC